MPQPKTKIVILNGRLGKRRKRRHSPTSAGNGSGNSVKRRRLRPSSSNNYEDSSELEPLSGGEDSEEFSEYCPTTDSECSPDDHHKAPNIISYHGFVIRTRQFVFVKNESSEDWLARVERVSRKKRKLYVRWMKEDGPEFVMDDGYAWISVDTIQDIARLERCVIDPDTEGRWVYQVPIELASLSPTGDQHTPLQTLSAEHAKSKTSDTGLRRDPTDYDMARTGRYALTGDNPEGDNNSACEVTSRFKLALFRPGSSEQGNLPSLWEVVGDYLYGGPCDVKNSTIFAVSPKATTLGP